MELSGTPKLTDVTDEVGAMVDEAVPHTPMA